MALHQNPDPPVSRNIIPSSGAIHTTNAEKRRTFYYSSLIIDDNHGPKQKPKTSKHSNKSKSRWKLYLGDIVAVVKSNPSLCQSTQEVIELWKPNHYVKKSPGWKIGLVIALRKVITRPGGINFECHIQWLEKSLDLDKDEMKSANLKSIYRPYNTNSNVGSQLPHVLINCPGDYGIVSMTPTSQIEEEHAYNIILPVNITMKTNRDFMRNGVKEGEESKYELQFCCTKTRRHLHHHQRKGEGPRVLPTTRSILNEREPDAWVHLNRPGANENSENSNDVNDHVPPLINTIPGPLQQAWKGWLQTESAIGCTAGNSIDALEPSLKENNTVQERISMLGDALMRGWSQSRRERYNKFILMREEQRRKNLEDKIKIDQGHQGANTKKSGTIAKSRSIIEKGTKTHDPSKLDSSATNVVGSTKRKLNTINQGDSTAIQAESATIKRKKKELRFSADTKQPSLKSISTSETSVTQLQNKKRSRGNASSRQQRTSSSRTMSEKTTKIEGINDDEAASTTTRDTHSTDTTLPTRGAGRKRKLKLAHASNKNSANDSDGNDNGINTTVSTVETAATISPSNVSDALDKWKVDSTFSEKAEAFYTKNNKSCFRELRMMIPLTDPRVRCLLDEDEAGILDQHHCNNHDINCQQFHIKVGSVVVVHYKGSISTTNSWSPFRVPWGVAQVTNIFREKNVDNEDDSWGLTIKWFYRYPELENGRRAKMLETMNKIDGLVETSESCDCSVKELLPAYIDLTSDTEEFSRYPRQEQGNDGFPIVRMLCQHIERSRGKFRRQSDWTYGHRTFLQRLPSSLEDTLPGPFKRAVEKMPTQLKKNFNTQFEDNSYQRERNSRGAKKEILDSTLAIVPGTIGAPYEQGGIKYFDSICINVQKMHLQTLLRAKSSNRWTIIVGHVIAVDSQHASLGKMRGNPRGWYPFQKKWCPAQVVALYKKKSGTWMMEIRWFDRYQDVLEQHKDSIAHLNSSHVVFETEVYEHVPVAAALPGRVILTSIESKQSWDATLSDTTGLPLIPRLCKHFCFDEEIEICTDWTNYDLNLLQIPPGLSRGLLLSPRNRQKKEFILLSRYYTKMIKKRGIDPDHNCLHKWSEERNHLTQKNKSFCNRFKPEDSTVELGSCLLTVNLERGSQDFFRSVTVHSPTTYVASPTMEMKRRKKNLFDCMVGDIVCYFDKNASTSESYTSTNHLRYPWYPFQIPWSYGQILTIYKESKEESEDDIKIEVRRFYKLSELSDEAKEFLSLRLEVNREEIFESNDIATSLDASCILGTANVFLGNHASSGNENISLGRQKFITSCRCKFFYLKPLQRLQPIYWSSMFPAGWHQGLQQRGYQRSNFVKKYDNLRQVLVRIPDKGPICDMLTSSDNLQKEGSCVRLGKSIQLSPSRRSLYAEAALHPQWSLFCASEYLSLADSSEKKSWTLTVGDIVAVKDLENTRGNASFPFVVPWFPGQILAIFNESDTKGLNTVHFEIRCLKFETSSGIPRRKVTTCHPSKIVTLTSTSLLGPLVIYFPKTNFQTDLTATQTHLPLSEFMGTDSLEIDTESALALSNLYTAEETEKLRQLPRMELRNFQPHKSSPLNSEASNEHECIPSESVYQLFRVDKLNLRSFYTEISLMPQFKIFRGGVYVLNSTSKTVRIGDTIRVRFEGSKRFPYDCNWGVAEVVAIFEEFRSKDELNRKQQSNPKEQRQSNFKIEIRWLYERHDISMSVLSTDDRSELIEVFETDHCQVMDASIAVLDHVQLVENDIDITKGAIQYFLCTRFWSTKRRSLIPCSGLKGRIKRGLIYSTLGLENDLSKTSSFRNDVIPLSSKSKNWKDSMANLICKLTLKDASKNAYASGEALVGRETEMSQLLSFLRGAFFEDRRSAGYKSSMFLAGPPGVVSHSQY
jgi:hypothetical protein